jgi:hypothetical protein
VECEVSEGEDDGLKVAPAHKSFQTLYPSHLELVIMDMEPRTYLTRAEKETETAAERLTMQIERALAAVAIVSHDYHDLEARADRLERAARDLAVALRELAHERRRDRYT